MSDNPNTPKQDARAFERWAAELSPDWPVELQLLAGRALLAFKQMDQPRAEQIKQMAEDCATDIRNFYTAYSAFIASQGTPR